MAWTKKQILLAITMVTCGSINTLSTKWADKIESKGSDGVVRPFNHPFVQSSFMFFGEFLCLLTFKFLYFYFKRKGDGSENENGFVKGNRNFSPFILFIPACCDMVATSIMYTGLNLTYASSFQMLRGSVIVFVGFLSFAFLGRTFVARQWSGILFIISGLAMVGTADFLSHSGSDNSVNNVITGDLLIVLAQIITSCQMVYEEKFVGSLDIPPLQAVGWEGVFGFCMISCLLVPFYFIHVPAPFSANAHGVLEDLPDALCQIANNPLLIVAITGTILSIATFNFAGISVTKEISATTRMVLDSVRTFVIWMVSLAIGWQKEVHGLEVAGFCSLIFGLFMYNGIIVPQIWEKIKGCFGRCCNRGDRDQMDEPIINAAADEPHV
ncbi:solute carrier family 35 member F6 [Culicoides brevitarsis]|uniref:solute carrier family 35 member F6 n=1 Tax=Culicoides brevitarsis TaxID=469753 RepID=UPI00307B8705